MKIAESESNESEGQSWALIIAGSRGWYNYRHQADVCHAYQILKNGIPDERIVVMMYDDIAKNPLNPTPNMIINHPKGRNVYKDVPRDYVGDDVTPENFLNILSGNKSQVFGGNGKVIDSGPNDRIFVYFADHGAPGLLGFPKSLLYASDILKTLNFMYDSKKYDQMVLYIEACESGSLFKHNLPKNINIYATTAANYKESSYACYFDNERRTYLGDVYSVNWMEDSDRENLSQESLLRQFNLVKSETNTSHVQEFGDLKIAQESVSTFQGHKNIAPIIVDPVELNAVKSEDVSLEILKHNLKAVKSPIEAVKIQNEIDRLMTKRQEIRYKFQLIVSHALDGDKLKFHPQPQSERLPLKDLKCYETIVKYFNEFCFDLSHNDNEHALRHLYNFVNLCEKKITTERIKNAIKSVCIN